MIYCINRSNSQIMIPRPNKTLKIKPNLPVPANVSFMRGPSLDSQTVFMSFTAIGNEIKGISKSVLKKADKVIHLPMLGKKESLNVSVAFGVIGYWIRCSEF